MNQEIKPSASRQQGVHTKARVPQMSEGVHRAKYQVRFNRGGEVIQKAKKEVARAKANEKKGRKQKRKGKKKSNNESLRIIHDRKRERYHSHYVPPARTRRAHASTVRTSRL